MTGYVRGFDVSSRDGGKNVNRLGMKWGCGGNELFCYVIR